jgi:hypothetical protein
MPHQCNTARHLDHILHFKGRSRGKGIRQHRRIHRTSCAEALINESPERTRPTFPHIRRRNELRNFSGSSRSVGRPRSSSSSRGMRSSGPETSSRHGPPQTAPHACRTPALPGVSCSPDRFAPCTPLQATSPAANNPGKVVAPMHIRPDPAHHIVGAGRDRESILPSCRCRIAGRWHRWWGTAVSQRRRRDASHPDRRAARESPPFRTRSPATPHRAAPARRPDGSGA